MTLQDRYRNARTNVLNCLHAGTSLSFCWAVYQEVLGYWQTLNNVSFVELVNCDRQSMIDHLMSLEK